MPQEFLRRTLHRVYGALVSRWRRWDAHIFGVPYSQYHRLVRKHVAADGISSVLDVGCGDSSPVARFASALEVTVGVDRHLPSIMRGRSRQAHSEYVVADVLDIGAVFPENSFDCVTLLEVIEHLSRDDGYALLAQCERIARKRVVVSTPNGFLQQPARDGNPFQEHLSGWTRQDFEARDYRVIGTAGWKPLRGELMIPRHPRWLTGRLSLLTEAWFERRPDLAFQLLCVRDHDAQPRQTESSGSTLPVQRSPILRGDRPSASCRLTNIHGLMKLAATAGAAS
jgi:SAM-dependent methyltransferase